VNLLVIAWRDELLENAQINGRHVLEANVGSLRLHSGLRIHLLDQFQHRLHVQDLNHILDDHRINQVFYCLWHKAVLLLLEPRIECHFLVVQLQEFALHVLILLDVGLDMLQRLWIIQEELLAAQLIYELQVKGVLPHLQQVDLS
jgi:hypothetical protein